MMDSHSSVSSRAFFGRRKGRALKPRQAALFDTLLPRLALDLSKSSPTDLRTLFTQAEDIHLEIGFGSAEHLIAQACEHPTIGFIGSDAFINGVAKALAEIYAHELSNIRLHFGDASALIDWLPAGALLRIDLLYPDPWPKRRHWKRRFIQDESLKRLARLRLAQAVGGFFRHALRNQSDARRARVGLPHLPPRLTIRRRPGGPARSARRAAPWLR